MSTTTIAPIAAFTRPLHRITKSGTVHAIARREDITLGSGEQGSGDVLLCKSTDAPSIKHFLSLDEVSCKNCLRVLAADESAAYIEAEKHVPHASVAQINAAVLVGLQVVEKLDTEAKADPRTAYQEAEGEQAAAWEDMTPVPVPPVAPAPVVFSHGISFTAQMRRRQGNGAVARRLVLKGRRH